MLKFTTLNCIKFFVILGLLCISTAFYAQAPDTPTTVNPTVESQSVVGIWNQVVAVKQPNGGETFLTTGTYKVINADGTFFTFVVTNNQKMPSYVGIYGTYKLSSDSTMTEHIVNHAISPRFSDKDALIRFQLIDNNTMAMSYNIDGSWTSEMWKRVLPYSKAN